HGPLHSVCGNRLGTRSRQAEFDSSRVDRTVCRAEQRCFRLCVAAARSNRSVVAFAIAQFQARTIYLHRESSELVVPLRMVGIEPERIRAATVIGNMLQRGAHVV